MLPLLGTLTLAFLEWVRGEAREKDYLPPEGDIDVWELEL